jgi:hypothetical protein
MDANSRPDGPLVCQAVALVAARLAQRSLRTDVACARALLDALEAVLDAENDERTRRDVIVQMAGQLTRVAGRMEAWRAAISNSEPSAGM